MSIKGHRPEEALTSSEQDLPLLVETIPTLVWRAAPEGNIVYVNKRVLEYLGAPLGEVIGWGWMDKVHPDDVAFKVRTWLQNLESGRPHDAACRIRGADGRYRWFEVRGEPLRANDKVLSWCGVLIDIDDRRRTEEALRESEYKLRQIIETVPSLLWSLGPNGEQTQLNQRALDYIGVRYEDLLRLGWTTFLHPDDLSETANAFSHAMQTGTSFQAVHRLRRADGEYFWHHARGEPLRDGQGRVIQWYGLTVDVDEGKQAEDRLRRSEAYLAEAQRLSHTGSFGWKPFTGELHWSDETFRILEYDLSVKPTIERVLQRVHPDDLARVRQVLDETSRGDKVDVTHRLSMPDGSIKFVHVLGYALKDAAGNLEIVGAVMDVTENTRLYRDLAEREAKIRRLVDANIVGIFIWDFEGRILEANDAFLRTIGYDRDDVAAAALRWTDLTPPDWRERDEQWVREHKASGLRSAIEKEYFRRDGSRVPVLVGAATFEEGGSQGVGFVIDLTELKRAERAARLGTEALRRSEAYLAEAQELSHTGSAAFNHTTILYWSEETYRIFGFDPRDGLPDREAVAERTHPDDRERVREQADRAVQKKRDYTLEYRLVLPAGTIKHVELNAHPKFSTNGELVEIVSTLIDVTERKRAEEERKKDEERLRLSEGRLAEAQALSHSGVAAYDETTILYGSEETYRIWGFDPAQGIPSREAVNQRIHPDDRDRVLAETQRAVSEKRDYSIGFRIVLPDGTTKHLESIGRPMFSASGELVEIVVTHLDVTERKRAEEALRESEQRFRDYAQAASDWYWETDPDHKFTRITDYERLLALGFAPMSRIGLTRWDYATDVESEPEKWRLHRSLLEARQPFRDFVYRAARSDGSLVFYKTNGKPIYDAKGVFLGYRGTGADVTAIMRGEAALQESEYKLRQIIEAVPGLVWSAGPAGEPNYANQRLLDYTGTPLEDFKNRNWQRFLHPDDLPESVGAFDHAVQTGRSYEAVLRLRRSNGEYRWHHVRGEPLRGREGHIIQWYGLSVDVDEAKKAEDQLRRSEAHLAEAQKLSHTGSAVYSETAILYWSEEAFRIWGFDPLQGLPSREAMLQRIHPDDRDRHHQETKAALCEKRDCSIEFRIVLPEGTIRDVEKIYHPVFSTSGELVEIVASGIDVTDRMRAEEERKKAEERLRLSEARLAEAQRLSQTGSWAWSPDQDIGYWSDECYRVLSFDPQDGLPRFEEFFQRIHPDDQPGFREVIQTAIREKAEWEADYRIVHPDGSVRDIYVVGHPVLSTSGHLVEFVGTVIDVTERRRAEQERARLHRLEADLAHINRVSTLGEMAASLAHEITQPIAAARNNARAALNFLDQQPPDLGEVGEALGCVVGDADRAGLIVDRIRDHIKKAPPRKHRFDLNEAISEVILLARSAMAENGVSVGTHLTDELAPVEGDRVQLQQVILNLALNAAEAMSALDEGARELLISTEQSRKNGVLVAVRDSGPGIDPERIERIFDAFYTTKSNGMGMGLSICRSIIEAHGGRLWADANEPRGAVFQFSLPTPERSS